MQVTTLTRTMGMPMTHSTYIISLLARLAIVMVVWQTVCVHATPIKHTQAVIEEEQEHNLDVFKGPLYEHQIAVWPIATMDDDIHDDIHDDVHDDVHNVDHDDGKKKIEENIPLFEEQQIVFPLHLFDEDDNLFDESEEEEPTENGPSPAPFPSSSSSSSSSPLSEAHVVERFQMLHENGTREYKLVMSNGLVSYMKLYPKTVDGKLITVQEGYDSVPVPSHLGQFHTRYYIADERGNNVYKVTFSSGQPEAYTLQLHPKSIVI